MPTPALRILVVDDSVDSADSLSMLLQINGHDTRTAFDGVEAVECAGEFRPQVILLDIGLPGMDGYEVARRLRSDPAPAQSGVILIAITGYGRDSDIALAREAGFDAHLVKPLDFEELERLVTSLSQDRA